MLGNRVDIIQGNRYPMAGEVSVWWSMHISPGNWWLGALGRTNRPHDQTGMGIFIF